MDKRYVTLEDVILKSRKKHGDKYEYVELIKEKGKNTKIVVLCPEHGEFTVRAARHYTEGQGCPVCSRRTPVKEFIAKAVGFHGEKYNYSKVQFDTMNDKVVIICPIHGEFTQQASAHAGRDGCPDCGIASRSLGQTKNTEEFVRRAQVLHGDKYDYSKVVYTKAIEKVVITCPLHGDFQQRPSAHLFGNGQGCPTCGGRDGKTTEDFINDAKKLHGVKYTYDKVVYTGALHNVTITCPEHGDFEQQASNHITKNGCPACAVTGFDTMKPGIMYYIEVTHEGSKYFKIGITNLTVQQRFTSTERNKIRVISITKYERGEDAYNEEQKLLKQYKDYRYEGPNILKSGNTELFTKDVLGGSDG